MLPDIVRDTMEPGVVSLIENLYTVFETEREAEIVGLAIDVFVSKRIQALHTANIKAKSGLDFKH